MLVGNILSLTTIGRDVEQLPLVVQAKLLGTDRILLAPNTQQQAFRPIGVTVGDQRCKAAAIQRLAEVGLEITQIRERRQQIDRAQYDVCFTADRNLIGKAHEAGTAEPTFIDRALASLHAAVEAI